MAFRLPFRPALTRDFETTEESPVLHVRVAHWLLYHVLSLSLLRLSFTLLPFPNIRSHREIERSLPRLPLSTVRKETAFPSLCLGHMLRTGHSALGMDWLRGVEELARAASSSGCEEGFLQSEREMPHDEGDEGL